MKVVGSDKKGRTDRKIQREKARRHFKTVEDVWAEVDRLVATPADIALDEAVALITDDVWEQEAHAAGVRQLARDLARGSDDPRVVMWCRMIAQYQFYTCCLDASLFRSIGAMHRSIGSINNCCHTMAFRFERALKSLADVLGIDRTEIRATLSGYRVVG